MKTNKSHELGTLRVLPLEVRSMIWSYIGQYGPVMCAGRAMHYEIHHFIYDNLCLTFEQRPPERIQRRDKQKRRNLLCTTVTTSYGTALEPIGLMGMDLPRWLKQSTSSQKLLRETNCLNFILRAPPDDDPGQLIQSWFANRRLLARFELVAECRLPPIRVCVVIDEESEWCSKKHWSQTWTVYEEIDESDQSGKQLLVDDPELTDLEIALTPFLMARTRARVFVELPTNIARKPSYQYSRVCVLAENIERGVPSFDTEIYNFNYSRLVFGNLYDDRMELERLRSLRYLQLHRRLDNMPGPTAAILRRERFAAWDAEHEAEHFICYHNVWQPYEDNASNTSDFEEQCEDFQALYTEMRAWNPWSLKRYEAVGIMAATDEERELKKDMDAMIHSQEAGDGWCVKTWAAQFPDGIPPRDSPEYVAEVVKYKYSQMDLIVLCDTGIQHHWAGDEISADLGGWECAEFSGDELESQSD